MIGYYAHGQGSGHCNYAQLLADFLQEKLVVFTDSRFKFNEDVQVVKLSDEHIDGTEFNRKLYREPQSLHYAPINLRKITSRNSLLLQSVLNFDVKLLIVDVSVEIAMLARVSSIPYAYVRLMGERSDFAHTGAYQGAVFLMAYFPKEMEMEDTPEWIVEKTIYLGFISKYLFKAQSTPKPQVYNNNKKIHILHLLGFGGTEAIKYNLDPSKFNLVSVGPGRTHNHEPYVTHMGVVDCTRAFIEHADIIIAACGSNTTSEILNLGKTFIAIEEKRHFDEHGKMAEALYSNRWALPLRFFKSLPTAIKAFESMAQVPSIPNGKKELIKFIIYLCANMNHIDRLRFAYPDRGVASIMTGIKNNSISA